MSQADVLPDSALATGSSGERSTFARYPGIDGLRGISILLVILLHIELRISFEPDAAAGFFPRALWSLLCKSGKEGVRSFFVISGFLITSSAFERWGTLPRIQ